MIYLCQKWVSLGVCGSQSPGLPCRQDLALLEHPLHSQLPCPAAAEECGAGTGRVQTSREKQIPPQPLDLSFVSAMAEADKVSPCLKIIQFSFFSLTSMFEPALYWIWLWAFGAHWREARTLISSTREGSRAGFVYLCVHLTADYNQVLKTIFLLSWYL